MKLLVELEGSFRSRLTGWIQGDLSGLQKDMEAHVRKEQLVELGPWC